MVWCSNFCRNISGTNRQQQMFSISTSFIVCNVRNKTEATILYQIVQLGAKFQKLLNHLSSELQQGEVIHRCYRGVSFSVDPLTFSLLPILGKCIMMILSICNISFQSIPRLFT